jgi:hypothetical protein
VVAGPAPAETAAISLVDARSIVTAVIEPFRPAVGSYVIQTFDDLPRQASEVVLKTPIAIVVGDSRISPVLEVYSNCRADSSIRTIRCDLRLLDDLIDDFHILYSEDQREAAREHILQLVIAHELGHIVYGDRSAGYHGSDNGFRFSAIFTTRPSYEPTPTPSASSTVTQRIAIRNSAQSSTLRMVR